MFYSEKKSDWYYLWSDESKGKYGPFDGVYIKNKEHWNINFTGYELEKYLNYRFVLWAWKKGFFVISWKGVLLFLPYIYE